MRKNGCPSKFEQFARQYTIITVLFLTPHIEDTMSKVRLTTNLGAIVIELNAEKAPKTVANFIEYVKAGHYDGTIFHRVIKKFMIQGGGHTADMKEKGKTQAPITNEADNGLKNEKYSIAMARTSDPHSATAQFFINTNDNEFLNFSSPTPSGWGYAVFGKVVEGSDVVDAIEQSKTSRSGFHQDVPVETVTSKKPKSSNKNHHDARIGSRA